MSEKYVGSCRYCGQIINSAMQFDTQKDADDYATEQCNCDEAQDARDRLEAVRRAIDNVYKFFGPDCTAYSFQPVGEDTLTALVDLTNDVAGGMMSAVTLKLKCGDTAKISITGKGVIKINRTKNISVTMES